ncbi:MAG: family 43 glycosylhydrolase [Clostridia bacterium]|nr:family 43 glycosylhydrolase [Clostridia bacterium]
MKNYPNPFIVERADPYITRGADGYYYFTASYPAVGDAEHGYDRIILRRSETVAGLSSAEEKTVWLAHKTGIMARHIWAPEIHFIGNKWYIFFAAGDSDGIWNIRPYVLGCLGADPYNDPWTEKGKVQSSEGDNVSFNSFSLDMTYFEHIGKHYLIWAEIIGDSSLFMAEINPEEPWKLISKPVLLTRPEYDWEKVNHRVNEGASVLKTKDKVYVFFSASGTGAEYCMGRLSADTNADLMKAESWKKLPEPVLQTSDLTGEAGPGHNSFVTDEDGNLLLVYHARPESHLKGECGTYCSESLYDPCRHARIKKVRFDEKGVPILK